MAAQVQGGVSGKDEGVGGFDFYCGWEMGPG